MVNITSEKAELVVKQTESIILEQIENITSEQTKPTEFEIQAYNLKFVKSYLTELCENLKIDLNNIIKMLDVEIGNIDNENECVNKSIKTLSHITDFVTADNRKFARKLRF